MQHKAKNGQLEGIFLSYAAMLSFSLGGLCVFRAKALSPLALNSARCFAAALLTLCFFKLTKRRPGKLLPALPGAFCMALTGFFYIYTAQLSGGAVAIALQYTSPVFSVLALWVFWKKRPAPLSFLAAACVALGAAACCATLPKGQGLITGMATGLLFAGVFLAGNLPGADPLTSCLLGELMSALWGINQLLGSSPSAESLFWAALMGMVQTGLAYLLLSLALKKLDAGSVNIICAQEPAFNILWLALFGAQWPSPNQIWGCSAILTGAVLLTRELYKPEQSGYDEEKEKTARRRHDFCAARGKTGGRQNENIGIL